MKKKYRYLCVILIALAVAALVYIVVLIAIYSFRNKFDYPTKEFVDNQKNEPYAQGIPLHEMNFDVYVRYLTFATTLLDPNYDRELTLPCDVDYYARKEEPEPAVTLKKGTEVCVLPGTKEFYGLFGYGLQCWPDYQEEWRYGCPFIAEDVSYIPKEHPMYYVKTVQLEKAAKAFYRENKKQLINACTPWDFPEIITQEIDRLLYDNGAYCPKRWQK